MQYPLEATYEFIEGAGQAKTVQALSDLFQKTLTKFGFSFFTHVLDALTAPTQRTGLVTSRYPSGWVKRYGEKRYVTVDPVVRNALYRHRPFTWHDDDIWHDISESGRRVFDEARQFSIEGGFTIPVHHYRRPPGAMNVATSEREIDPQSLQCAHIMSLHFHDAMIRLREPDTQKKQRKLTKRERECLCWVAVGKSDGEIADILGISTHTAHFHIENAKRKFDVRSRMQAVVRAFMEKEIMP